MEPKLYWSDEIITWKRNVAPNQRFSGGKKSDTNVTYCYVISFRASKIIRTIVFFSCWEGKRLKLKNSPPAYQTPGPGMFSPVFNLGECLAAPPLTPQMADSLENRDLHLSPQCLFLSPSPPSHASCCSLCLLSFPSFDVIFITGQAIVKGFIYLRD